MLSEHTDDSSRSSAEAILASLAKDRRNQKLSKDIYRNMKNQIVPERDRRESLGAETLCGKSHTPGQHFE